MRVAVCGKAFLQYAPLTIAERLGYFKDAGVDIEIVDVAGGARALEALVGGSAEVTAGAFDHTIQMQAKKPGDCRNRALRPSSVVCIGGSERKSLDIPRRSRLEGHESRCHCARVIDTIHG
jgi:ABC-type nitrate/sulfonate/bicarbonate transport system substrate-binding protein